MSGKEKFEYFWKIAFLVIFGLIIGVAGVYTVATYPFSLATVIYGLFAVSGLGACGLFSWKLIKEYIETRKAEKE